MSIHSSLRGGASMAGERSVFTRTERLAILKKAGKFNDTTDSVYGIPKVRTRFKIAGAKKKEAKAEAAPGGAVGAKPAAGGAAAKPAAGAAAKPAAKK
jgi:small basic protein (TIGR04137 family)